MSGNLYLLPLSSQPTRTADETLDRAREHGLTDAIVIGWDAKGEAAYFSTTADGAVLLWLIEKFKHRLLSGDFAK
jgi:hypothetical protein